MGLLYEIRTEREQQGQENTSAGSYAVATGYAGNVSILRIPPYVSSVKSVNYVNSMSSLKSVEAVEATKDIKAVGAEAEGNANEKESKGENENTEGRGRSLPLRVIGSHAFEKREDLREADIPETVEELSSFCFFHCPNLSRLRLTDRVREYHHGVTRQCGSLRRVDIRFFREGNFRILKDLLQDCDRRLIVHLSLPDGEAELAFPAYLDGFQEDTMARAIHARIEGSGYSYRQVVSRAEVDFHAYDKLFGRATYDDPRAALAISLGRLRYPYRLSPEARRDYAAYLQERNGEALLDLLREKDMDGVRFLAQEIGLSQQSLREAFPFLAKTQFLEATAFLLEYQRTQLHAGQGHAGAAGFAL